MPNEGSPHGGTKVVNTQVLHVNSTETAKLKLPDATLLQQMWDKAYEDLAQYGVTRGPADVLQCAQSNDNVAPHLDKSLAQVRDDKICTNLHFKIIADRGGANGDG